MKYALRGITAEELSYSMNRIKADKDTKFEIRPQFSRTVRRVAENDKIWFVAMEVKVESTEESPKPFNMKARLVGMFSKNNNFAPCLLGLRSSISSQVVKQNTRTLKKLKLKE